MTDTGNFKREAWNAVLEKFNREFNTEWELQTLETEYTNTKAKYQVFQTPMNLSGQPFSYEEETSMVQAEQRKNQLN